MYNTETFGNCLLLLDSDNFNNVKNAIPVRLDRACDSEVMNNASSELGQEATTERRRPVMSNWKLKIWR